MGCSYAPNHGICIKASSALPVDVLESPPGVVGRARLVSCRCDFAGEKVVKEV